jgi:hypothetical protein
VKRARRDRLAGVDAVTVGERSPVAVPVARYRIVRAITAFWAWSRFSASS